MGEANGAEVGLDGFVITAATPYATVHRWLHRIEAEVVAAFNPRRPNGKHTVPPSRQEIATADPAIKIQMLFALMTRILYLAQRAQDGSFKIPGMRASWDVNVAALTYSALNRVFCMLLGDLTSDLLPLDSRQIQTLLESCGAQVDFDVQYKRNYLLKNHVPLLLKFLSRYPAVKELSPELLPQLEALHDRCVPDGLGYGEAIAGIFGYNAWDVMRPGAPWTNTILRELRTMTPDARAPWLELLHLARTADKSRPGQNWLKEAGRWQKQIGREAVVSRILNWLGEFHTQSHYNHTDIPYLHGLIWMTLLCPEEGADQEAEKFSLEKISHLLERLAVELSSHMHRLIRHACYTILTMLPGRAPLLALVRLQTKTKDAHSRQFLNRLLASAAEKAGLTSHDLTDLVVPTGGLDGQGCLRQSLGHYTVEVSFLEEKPVWRWKGANGKSRKSVPPEVKSEHTTELTRCKQQVAEILAMRDLQCERIEHLYRDDHHWNLPDWQERYAAHPLLLCLVHRLIWQFTIPEPNGEAQIRTGLWRDGRFEDAAGSPIRFDTPTEGVEQTSSVYSSIAVRVDLWHPVASDVETVLAWRTRLEALGIEQPFKQAHREAYLLTDAERATNFYSNRFAAHIIRQFVFHRHCKRLGWQNRLRIVNGSSDKRAVYPLPDWGLQAEFWVETVDDPRIIEGSVETYNYLSTDQVRFRKQRQRRKPGEPLPTDPHQDAVSLADVHPRLFWEIMRDVDAMVARASIANDPTWQDRGITLSLGSSVEGNNRYAYTGVELGLPERRAMLEKLLPRLNIASRCTLTDIFLVVRGDVRTYKIHLGSGNILMEPNDQYLCIIRSRANSSEPNLHPSALSFEGDSTLSLILSKAVLLASDSTVTDPVILQQIRPRK